MKGLLRKVLHFIYSAGFVTSLTSLLFSGTTSAQSWLWAKQAAFTGTSQSDGEAYSVATDNAGNVYETGFFAYASMRFGNTTLTSINGDLFLVKYNSSGVVQWARQGRLQSAYSYCEANFVTTDVSGNVYVTGFFVDTINFGAYSVTSSSGHGEIFVVKYDKNGNALWAKASHGVGFDGNYNWGYCVATDPSGNVYLTGQFETTTSFGPYTLSNPAGQNNHYGLAGSPFIVKYDANGNVLWARQGNLGSSTCFASARAIATDASGNVFITGAFNDTISFGPQMLTTNSGVGEIFTAKYDNNGNFLWARQTVNNSTDFWSNGPVFGNAIVTDNAGSVYVAGNFEDTIFFGSTELISPISFANYAFPYGDMFLAKYDANGNLAWAQAAYPLTNGAYAGWGVATDTLGHVYFEAGCWNVYSSAQLTFSVQFGQDTFTSIGQPSIESALLLKLDTAGNVQCGSMIPIGGDENSGVAVDPSGKYVYMGSDYFVQNNVVIGPDTLNIGSNPMYAEVPFLLRWLPCNTTLPLTVSVSDSNATCYRLCNGSAIATPAGGSSPYTYSWNTIPVDTAGHIRKLCAGSYSVTVTDGTGITATASATITQPNASPVNISAPTSVCAGDSAFLTAISQGSDLQWQSSGNGTNFVNITGAKSSTYSNTLSQTTYFRVTSNNGICSDTSSPFKLSVKVLVSPSVFTNDSLICSGDSTHVCTANTYISYLWNTLDTSYCTTVNQAGGYWVAVRDTNGCSAVSAHQNIYVYQVPPVSITVASDTLTSYNSNSYQWYLNDTIITGATSAIFIARQTGNYAVEIVDANGCPERSNDTYLAVNGTNELQVNDKWAVYPDPFTNLLFVSNNMLSNYMAAIDIYDVLGRVALHKSIKDSGKTLTIDAGNLPEGLYLLKISAGDQEWMQKIIKQ